MVGNPFHAKPINNTKCNNIAATKLLESTQLSTSRNTIHIPFLLFLRVHVFVYISQYIRNARIHVQIKKFLPFPTVFHKIFIQYAHRSTNVSYPCHIHTYSQMLYTCDDYIYLSYILQYGQQPYHGYTVQLLYYSTYMCTVMISIVSFDLNVDATAHVFFVDFLLAIKLGSGQYTL